MRVKLLNKINFIKKIRDEVWKITNFKRDKIENEYQFYKLFKVKEIIIKKND